MGFKSFPLGFKEDYVFYLLNDYVNEYWNGIVKSWNNNSLPINEVFVYSLRERLIQYNIQVNILYHIQGSQDQGC